MLTVVPEILAAVVHDRSQRLTPSPSPSRCSTLGPSLTVSLSPSHVGLPRPNRVWLGCLWANKCDNGNSIYALDVTLIIDVLLLSLATIWLWRFDHHKFLQNWTWRLFSISWYLWIRDHVVVQLIAIIPGFTALELPQDILWAQSLERVYRDFILSIHKSVFEMISWFDNKCLRTWLFHCWFLIEQQKFILDEFLP